MKTNESTRPRNLYRFKFDNGRIESILSLPFESYKKLQGKFLMMGPVFGKRDISGSIGLDNFEELTSDQEFVRRVEELLGEKEKLFGTDFYVISGINPFYLVKW